MTNKEIEVDEVVIKGTTYVPKGSESGTVIPVQSGSVGIWQIGENYFIRTVTYHFIGKLVHVTDSELVFDKASWIAVSGRWNESLRTGKLDEVEPYTDTLIVGRGSLIDATKWNHDLPTQVK